MVRLNSLEMTSRVSLAAALGVAVILTQMVCASGASLGLTAQGVALRVTNSPSSDNSTGPSPSQMTEGQLCMDYVGPTIVCGDGLCRCDLQWEVAQCTVHSSGYIPRLPPTIHTLCFNDNLTTIARSDFFHNVSHVSELDLHYTSLESVHPGAFSALTNLSRLDLGYNLRLSAGAVSVALHTSVLRELCFWGSRLGRLTPEIFTSVDLPHLRVLNLMDNEIENLALGLFASLKTLRTVYLANNRLHHTHIDSVLHLSYLDLSRNNLYDFPNTCSENRSQSFFPNLRNLMLRENYICSLPSDVCLPKLEFLDLSSNWILELMPGSFVGTSFPRLRVLDLSDDPGVQAAEVHPGAFVNLSVLEEVNLAFNIENVSIDCLQRLFTNCPNVAHLDFSGSTFESDVAPGILADAMKVESLVLAHCGVSVLSPGLFCPLNHLQSLTLSHNSLDRLPEGAFDCLPLLAKLDLSHNHIQVISPGTFGLAPRLRLTHLDLSSNPFQCSCDLLWFQSWMRESRSLFSVDADHDYSCENLPGVSVEKFELSQQACLLSHGTYIAIVYVCALLVVIIVVMVAVFRYHWHLRLLLYEAFRSRDHGRARMERLLHGTFDYDVFVSYDSEDFPWVSQHLIPELEGRQGLRLCLHQRDFIAGRFIVDNIVSCVESSKKILMLFSANFAASRWCQFELSFCLSHVMEHEDSLVVVCLDRLVSRDVSPAMTAVLKVMTYIPWTEDGGRGERESFWQGIREALREILHEEQV